MHKKLKPPILAKPSGITLAQHSKDVEREGINIIEAYPYLQTKYEERIGKDLKERVRLASLYHDSGKAHPQWQSACQADYKEFLKWQKVTGGTFKEYAKQVGAEAGKNLRRAKLRHEFQSLVKENDKKLPFTLEVAIGAHHGKLSFKDEQRWKDEPNAFVFWKKFRKENAVVIDDKSFEQAITKHYEISGVRGYVQVSDHRASAIEENDWVPEFKHFQYDFPHKEKRNVQALIEENWEDDLLLIRAPTGAGKTDASLLWAQKQIENNRADRLIIAMPTRFTSNALAINVTESLSDTGLYHSTAWFTNYQEGIKEKRINQDHAKKLHAFSRLLLMPVTVCTIDHLLTALTLSREDHHLICFNLAHSCLVIDEADFYDDFTLANITILLQYLHQLKVPILLMSASLPKSTLPVLNATGYNVNEIKEDISDIDRDRFTICSIQESSNPSEIESIMMECLKNNNAIIYANTIERAYQYYKWFLEKGVNVTLYHSRFTEPDKKKKEDELLEKLGRKAWEAGNAHGIAILTQIGEMSINISADIMVSDICPIDRLTQRAGRLCRFDSSKLGKLYLIIPKKNDELYPAPYGTYDIRENTWIPGKPLLESIKRIKIGSYSAKRLVSLIEEIYPIIEFSELAESNAKLLKDHFIYNWLILPKARIAEDDTETSFWKSRNIFPQETVYTTRPSKTYFNYLEFQEWKINNSIEIPMYMFEKGIENHTINREEFYFKDEKISAWVVVEQNYSFEKGLILSLSEDTIL